MNITFEYVFVNPELNEIEIFINNTIEDYIKNMVIVIGADWIIYKIFGFLIK